MIDANVLSLGKRDEEMQRAGRAAEAKNSLQRHPARTFLTPTTYYGWTKKVLMLVGKLEERPNSSHSMQRSPGHCATEIIEVLQTWLACLRIESCDHVGDAFLDA